jgi:hypothetical protein
MSMSVTKIGEAAFFGCVSLKSIELPPLITSIEVGTFFACESLTSIEIPPLVKTIGKQAFDACYNFETAKVPQDCSLGTFAFPSSTVIIRY